MSMGLVGRKCGMTRIFGENGDSIPVTVIEVQPNKVTQIKNVDNDGYTAIQVTTGSRRASRVNKALGGHFAKANVAPGRGLWEFTLGEEELTSKGLTPGSEITVELFSEGQYVDVTGVTKGKGFQGVVKRHHFATQDASHGNSLSHRVHGSTGQRQSPGRVFKGKKMAGHMGSAQRTIQNLQIVKVDPARNLLLIKGAIPGAPNGDVIVKAAVKIKAEEK